MTARPGFNGPRDTPGVRVSTRSLPHKRWLRPPVNRERKRKRKE